MLALVTRLDEDELGAASAGGPPAEAAGAAAPPLGAAPAVQAASRKLADAVGELP